MVKQIIAHIGFQGSGKTYASEILVKEQGFKRLSFADSLRSIAFNTLGMKNREGMARYTELKSEEIYNGQTFRNILENLASSIRRYDEGFFAKALIYKIKELYNVDSICIDDLRYANEFLTLENYCKQNNVKFRLIFCDYNSDRYDENNNHESTQLSRYLKSLGYKHNQIVQSADVQMFNFINKKR